jgi:hypothetical protein
MAREKVAAGAAPDEARQVQEATVSEHWVETIIVIDSEDGRALFEYESQRPRSYVHDLKAWAGEVWRTGHPGKWLLRCTAQYPQFGFPPDQTAAIKKVVQAAAQEARTYGVSQPATYSRETVECCKLADEFPVVELAEEGGEGLVKVLRVWLKRLQALDNRVSRPASQPETIDKTDTQSDTRGAESSAWTPADHPDSPEPAGSVPDEERPGGTVGVQAMSRTQRRGQNDLLRTVAEEVASLATRMDRLETKLNTVQEALQKYPTSEDLRTFKDEIVETEFSRTMAAVKQELDQVTDAVAERVAGRLPSNLRNARAKPAELPPLEGKAAEVFEKLKAITGTDAEARRQAQEVLNTYVGEPVTREFTFHFQHFLKEHGWRIVCLKKGCRQPAAPVWQRNERNKMGGRLECRHVDGDSGRSAKHGSMTTFRAVTLVEYRDRRYA